MGEPLDEGRRSFERRAWRAAHRQFAAADASDAAALGPDDLERWATAAHLAGEDEAATMAWNRSHQSALGGGDARRAARSAFWLAFDLILRGEMAPAFGWLARAERVLEEHGEGDCAERGLLLVPKALGLLMAGDGAGGLAGFTHVLAFGERFGDVDLATLGRLGRGQALVLGGRVEEGTAQLDDAMVAVVGGEVSPTVAGLVYCAVIDMCHLTSDLRRAREWTAALARWCESQPELVAYRGQCLVHRAEILQFRGDWEAATAEAEAAYTQLSRPPAHPAVGDALYRLAELARLRGDHARAEETYTRASEHGHDPQPGLARLRLAQGRTAVARAAIRRAMEEAPDVLRRGPLLAAGAEIALLAGDLEGAHGSIAELTGLAERHGTPLLRATSGHMAGLLRLAEGDAGGALAVLRPAWIAWRDLEVPYEAARVRVAVAAACRQLGDDDGADLELHAAERVFRQLGAVTDLDACRRPAGATVPDDAGTPVRGLAARPTTDGPLTGREVEVLVLVATGRTNKSIAGELVISEKTVARHLANIFTKLGLTSRAAATAYAYEHGLVGRTYTE